MGDLTTSVCDTVNSGLSTYPHVAAINLITSLSVLSVNPPIELLVISLLKFSDILPPLFRLLFAEMAGWEGQLICIYIYIYIWGGGWGVQLQGNGTGPAVLFSMGVKLRLLHWGRNIDLGLSRIGCWGRYFVPVRDEAAGRWRKLHNA